MLSAYLSQADPLLLEWLERNVSFPNSMVDRITPVTTPVDIDNLKAKFKIDDAWPVVCEPFCQWIIEDKFVTGRPAWEKVGAQFVSNVSPYEKMKIRILNAGHTLVGFLGILSGYAFVFEAMRDKRIHSLLDQFITKEVIPILNEVPGLDFEDYKRTIIDRFGNPHIKDQLTRIISGSSAKIPKFVIPTLNEQLERGGPIDATVLIIAMWNYFLEKIETDTELKDVHDDMQSVLLKKAKESISSDPLAFVKIDSIFGNLSNNTQFVDTFLSTTRKLRLSRHSEL
jgi:mannitol 2-dehydrogenase